jgi:hypothetical protein
VEIKCTKNAASNLKEYCWMTHQRRECQDENSHIERSEGNSDTAEVENYAMTFEQIQVMKQVVSQKHQELDVAEELLIERTYFICLGNILSLCTISTKGTQTTLSRIKNRNGRLPLHEAAFRYTCCFEHILKSYPEALSQQDSETNLFPFVIAAANPYGSLGFMFMLLQEHPNVISDQIVSATI